MPVTFKAAPHPANKVKPAYRSLNTADDLLAWTWCEKVRTMRSEELLLSSLVNPDLSRIDPSHNGFVNTVVDAYNTHHHLVLRPDDVWIAMLGQFKLYVNAHDRQKVEPVVRATVDFENLAHQMTGLIHENVVDKDLREWILPNFSTTTKSDTITCAVLMIATPKPYLGYATRLECGIPSVTLEGERTDWVEILERINKLDAFGEEPTAWAKLLRPILRRFVSAFDGEPDTDFWGKVCHHNHKGSGPVHLSGWITAFCVWSNEGIWQGPNLLSNSNAPAYRPIGTLKLSLDGVNYGYVHFKDVPSGFGEMNVKLDDDGEILDCMMVSGHLARLTAGEDRDTIRPLPTWFLFVKEDCEDPYNVAFRELLKQWDEQSSWDIVAQPEETRRFANLGSF
ncbi:hypothetical protein CPC08DRAFT_714199 [Agrocybe pediades]|nr:hypothetical protein CPC08DRAFT_714199 [Agrocybe pediades]